MRSTGSTGGDRRYIRSRPRTAPRARGGPIDPRRTLIRRARRPPAEPAASRRSRPAASAPRRCGTPSSTSACRRSARASWRPRSSTGWSRSTRSHVCVCETCFLVQLEEYVAPERDLHASTPTSRPTPTAGSSTRGATPSMMIERFGLGRARASSSSSPATTATCCSTSSRAGIPVLGIEPAAQRRRGRGRAQGVPHARRVLRRARRRAELRRRRRSGRPDRSATTCSPRCPDLNDFVGGHRRSCSRPTGVVTIEFPHLLRLIEENQFDTIYHEHFSYFSLATVERIFAAHGLDGLRRRGAADPRRLAAHLRAATPTTRRRRSPSASARCATRESAAGCDDLGDYRALRRAGRGDQARAARVPDRRASRAGKRVVGYGAPGKGNTLLNYCGIRTDFLDYTVDRNPYKQGSFLPGHAHPDPSRPSGSRETRPGLRADPAVEPARRDRRRSWPTSASGAASSSCPDPGCRGPTR